MEQNSFLKILKETLRQGGVLLFVEEKMTSEAKELLQALRDQFPGQIPFLAKTLPVLTDCQYHPQSKDLLFVGDLSLEDRQALAIVCRAQIVSQQKGLESLQDVTWEVQRDSVDSIVEVFQEFLLHDPLKINLAAGQLRVQKALFLDRDDVMVKNVPYNKDPSQVELIPGIVELIHQAHQNKMPVIVCSNQSGLGRGRITPEEYFSVHQKMLQLLAAKNSWIEECLWAGYIDGGTSELHLEPQMRKPRPGMFLQAIQKWNIDPSQSWMVGDSATDLIAASTAGVAKLVLLKSEKIEKEKALLLDYQKSFPKFQFLLAQNLGEVHF